MKLFVQSFQACLEMHVHGLARSIGVSLFDQVQHTLMFANELVTAGDRLKIGEMTEKKTLRVFRKLDGSRRFDEPSVRGRQRNGFMEQEIEVVRDLSGGMRVLELAHRQAHALQICRASAPCCKEGRLRFDGQAKLEVIQHALGLNGPRRRRSPSRSHQFVEVGDVIPRTALGFDEPFLPHFFQRLANDWTRDTESHGELRFGGQLAASDEPT